MELRKWTLMVSRDDPSGVIFGAERGHTDTDGPETFEAVHVIEVPHCPACGGEIDESDHTCSALLQPE